ncbi:antitoxin [Corynebacterium bouchesdurhonense]|uniref:antitoxin n=1 Tax=Corynebacterium bouchesdurhonense TaxID=1720192 RepID=UPI0008366CC4|nr:AbrB/MazE/SpoVT family DNA-binding domain-containing protein [Corynebacterium bouchesdurhonense]
MPKRLKTTIFKSGNSQAVRIPVSMRLQVDNVTIESVPEGLLLRPVEETIGDAVERLRAFQASEGIEGGLIRDVEELDLDPIDVIANNSELPQ